MNKENKKFTIGVVGLWHLGTVYAAALAELGQKVIAYDENKKTIFRLRKSQLPVEEPGLRELFQKHFQQGSLRCVLSLKEFGGCDVVWLTLDTPLKKDGGPDVLALQEALEKIAPHFKQRVVLVVSSQVPIGTGEKFKQIISSLCPKLKFSYVYQPENLQLGSALASFFKPGRIVLGTDDEFARLTLKKIFAPLQSSLLFMDVASAEMTKHALNAFLATSLSFIHDIADLCEKYGADVVQVSRALKSDPRIGEKAYLDASLGFSGGTLGRDLLALLAGADSKKFDLPVIRAAFLKNKYRWQIASDFLEKKIKGLNKISVALLGMTYKPGTSVLRHSLSLKLADDLRRKVGQVRCHDSLASREEARVAGLNLFADPYEAMKNCSAVLLMTAHPEYLNLDFVKIAALLNGSKIFYDARNFLWQKKDEIQQAGLSYYGIGRGKSL